MPARRNYYLLKPLIPWKVRMGLRRWRARKNLQWCRDDWPIKEGTQHPPANWPGWPAGKQFALLLTHDVEGAAGLNRCHQLMELEKSMGFRSWFNFIPEGEYTPPLDLREELTRQGFEVGVHDLRHDGKLFWSREIFRKNAQRINHYLNEWNAVGFRAGFMLHELDWIHDLNILYDASTFDTDPFEPQPDGMDTIFPFWVSRPATEAQPELGGEFTAAARAVPKSANRTPHSGYMELPYTLPQDSTLFVLFGEETIDIWKKKLDWIAERGGMALLNVHPDYVSFDGISSRSGRPEFHMDRYRELLDYVDRHYRDKCWHVLPRELAGYCAEFRPERGGRRRKRVCMLAYTYYESDNRVMRYAETLAKRGDSVDVVALYRPGEKPERTKLSEVKVWHVQERSNRQVTMVSYLVPILKFFFKSSFLIGRRHLRQPYDLIHVHNIPDFLVFAAVLPKLLGARLILDIHDIVPELFCAKFKKATQSLRFRVLKAIERWSCRFVDHVIVSNHLWQKKLIQRSVSDEKCSVFLNHVDSDIFYPHERIRHDDRLVMLFPGTLQWHQGIDIAILAFAKVLRQLPQAEFHIHGGGGVMEELQDLVRELGLEKKIFFLGTVPIHRMPEIIANADLGVVPKRTDSFGDEAYSTKIMEFMSQGVPVVVSRTAIDRYYFNDKVVKFFESGNVEELAQAILEMFTNQELRQSLGQNALKYVAKHNWNTRRREYLDLVDTLCEGEHFTSEIQKAPATDTETRWQEKEQILSKLQ